MYYKRNYITNYKRKYSIVLLMYTKILLDYVRKETIILLSTYIYNSMYY